MAVALVGCAPAPSSGNANPSADAGTDVDVSDADAGWDAPPVPASELEGRSFELKLDSAQGTESDWCAGPCGPITVHVERAEPDEITVVWGTPGNAERAKLTGSAQAWVLDAPFTLGQLPADYTLCPPRTQRMTAVLAFRRTATGDITLDVAGDYRTERCSEDTTAEYTTGTVRWMGVQDATSPALLLAASLGGLLAVEFPSSEPLRAGASVLLQVTGKASSKTLTNKVDAGFVVGAASELVLPFGSSITLTTTGEDLGGLALPASAPLATIADFGVLVADGFESPSTLGIWPASKVEIMQSFGGSAAIAGKQMLHVPAGVHAMLRLQRSGAESALVARVQMYTACAAGPSALLLTAGVVWGQARTEVRPEIGAVTPIAENLFLGAVQDVTIPLPDSGTDVVLAVQGENHVSFSCVHAGTLIDDVRLQ
jgi:hypothetical protein